MSEKKITQEGHGAMVAAITESHAHRLDERICLSYWHPLIEAAGLPVPRTTIVRAEGDLLALLDGEIPARWHQFITALGAAVDDMGTPCFLRTGQTSGKHEWSACCHLTDRSKLTHHVAMLVNWSCMVDMVGLPVDVWAVREMIPTAPLFTCTGYLDFPVVREFRFFADGERVTHVQPYWPPDACEDGRPDDPNWRSIIDAAALLGGHERRHLTSLAVQAAAACDGREWSVDFLQDVRGAWWLTDMAPGEVSFRWGSS